MVWKKGRLRRGDFLPRFASKGQQRAGYWPSHGQQAPTERVSSAWKHLPPSPVLTGRCADYVLEHTRVFRRPLLGAHELLSNSRLAAVSRRAPRYAPFLALVKIWTTIVHGGKSYTTGADMADWVDQGELVHVRDFAERDRFRECDILKSV